MRIIAGTAKGRRLFVPTSGTRPTSDRAREALFSTLSSLMELEGAHVLDLYAGSGAIGLEALSRGAAHVTFVESHRPTSAVLAKNIEIVRLPGATCRTMRAEKAARTLPAHPPYDLVVADPPYAVPDTELAAVLTDLANAGKLSDQAIIVVERSSRDNAWQWPSPYAPLRDRRYGEATLWFAAHNAPQ